MPITLIENKNCKNKNVDCWCLSKMQMGENMMMYTKKKMDMQFYSF
jgi:hypothetical protein